MLNNYNKFSIQSKYVLIFLITLILIITGLLAGLMPLRTRMLRSKAQAVADQVVTFRAWVAGAGMVWVDKLSPDFNDFLVERHDSTTGRAYYGKNPALATRELSAMANKTSTSVSFWVTSDNYRHKDNKPDDFEQNAINEFKTKKTKYSEDYKGGYYRFAKPILMKQGCLKCHGDPKDAPAAVIEKYSDKKAFGYKVGDVRGIISVRLDTIDIFDVFKTMANPLTIGLIVVAFILNFMFSSRVIINRLRRLTIDTKLIASGKLSTELKYKNPEESSDEVDHVYHSVHLLRQSLHILIKRYKNKKTISK